MEDLIILGAGGTSREIADAVADVNRVTAVWNLVGFLDDDVTKHSRLIAGLPVLGSIDSAKMHAGRFIIGVARAGDPWQRRRIFERLDLPRERLATIIHPTASLSSTASVGAGTAILQNAVVTTDAVIGDHVLIHYGCIVAHDAVVDDYVTMAPGSLIAGSVRLRSGVYLGAGSRVINDATVGEAALVGSVRLLSAMWRPEAQWWGILRESCLGRGHRDLRCGRMRHLRARGTEWEWRISRILGGRRQTTAGVQARSCNMRLQGRRPWVR